MTEIPLATVQRVVTALNKENLVISVSRNGGVRLGPGLIPLAAAVQGSSLAEWAHPFVSKIANEANETTDLSLFDRDKAVVIAQYTGNQELRAVSVVGDSLPLYCTASGKAVLSALPDGELRKLRRTLHLVPMTKNTIVSWEKLDREIAKIRETGVAFDVEEHRIGIAGAAIAITGPAGEYAAVGIKAPTHRLLERQQSITRTLAEHCQALQRHLQIC
jgi:DNA-binding IclR family transcriptional regulator